MLNPGNLYAEIIYKKSTVIANQGDVREQSYYAALGKLMDKKQTERKAYLTKIEAALYRAAKRARKTAEQTNTPLIIYKEGQITRKKVGKEMFDAQDMK